MNYLIAIDGGGTTCRALLCDEEGNILGRGNAGPSNITSDFDTSVKNIKEATNNAFAASKLPTTLSKQTSAILGLAGANIPIRTSQSLARHLEFEAVKLVSDSSIAVHGALGNDDGIVAVLGTGSAFSSKHNGKLKHIGGWGFNLSDQGSGAYIGHLALQKTLLANDGLIDASPLTEKLMAHFGNEASNIVDFSTKAKPVDYGEFAPNVFDLADEDDYNAVKIIKKSAWEVDRAINALKFEGCRRICLLGGTATRYEKWLSRENCAILEPAKNNAIIGAMHMGLDYFFNINLEY